MEQALMKCITPHAITGATPCSLFLGRSIQTQLDLLHLDFESQVQDK